MDGGFWYSRADVEQKGRANRGVQTRDANGKTTADEAARNTKLKGQC